MQRLFFAGLVLMVLAPFTYFWLPAVAIELLVLVGFLWAFLAVIRTSGAKHL